MACAVIYDSLTGNTGKLAEGLADRLAACGDIELAGSAAVSAGAEGLAAQADTVLFGFWTDKGACSDKAKAFLPNLAGKRVFLFGTAGFGGSSEYFDRILGNVQGLLPEGADYLGGAMCQGQMGESIKARYEKQATEHPDEPRWQLMLKTYEEGQGHPDTEDIERVAAAAIERLRA